MTSLRHRHWTRYGATLVAVVIVAALVFAANPELRALALFTDSLGLDLVALLLATQFKGFVHAFVPLLSEIRTYLCRSFFYMGNGAMHVYPKALAWRPFDKLLCPVLVFVTFGMRCRLANH